MLGVEHFNRKEMGLAPDDHVPDISIEPSERILSVINSSSSEVRSYYVTVIDVACVDAHGRKLEQGTLRDADGNTRNATTFIVRAKPSTIVDLCVLPARAKLDAIQLHSDVKVWHEYIHQKDEKDDKDDKDERYSFPLDGESFLCTQSCGGLFTHFYAQTYHAIDLECAVGTPCLAIAAGIIVSIRQEHNVSGIDTENLFHWNSLVMKTDAGRIVEYVHIKQGSCLVNVGDRVQRGDKLCLSGDVGFCPRPHLHIQMHDSDDAAAPTIAFSFTAPTGETFVPKAGNRYSAIGRVN